MYSFGDISVRKALKAIEDQIKLPSNQLENLSTICQMSIPVFSQIVSRPFKWILMKAKTG